MRRTVIVGVDVRAAANPPSVWPHKPMVWPPVDRGMTPGNELERTIDMNDLVDNSIGEAGEIMGDVMEAAGEMTSRAAEALIEGAVIAVVSSPWRSKRVLAIVLAVLALAVGMVLWRRREDDRPGSSSSDADTRKAA